MTLSDPFDFRGAYMGYVRIAFQKSVFTALSLALLVGCSNAAPTFSLMADTNSFSQEPSVIAGKIDMLFVVDNSGSMDSSQQNLANNMQAFIETFQSKGMDFRMAVTATDAYRVQFGGAATMAQFRDGTNQTSHTGVYVIDPTTPNLTQTFLINMRQGINGSGDERAFQSFKAALSSPLNESFDFPRADAFLAVIILSDEDDYSHDGSESRAGQYSYSGMHTIQSYVDWLDQLTGSVGGPRKHNVNSITITDQACLDTLNAESPGRKIGLRYQDLSNATNGIIGSLCGNFGATLASISNRIIQLSTKFYLDRQPKPETIRVHVNGELIPNSDTNGWIYDATDNSIVFPGSYTPPSGASISVYFDPMSIK